MKALFSQKVYKDKYLIIFGLPLISILVQHLGLSSEESADWFSQDEYFPTLLYNFLGIGVIFISNKKLFLELDKRIPFRPKFRKRMLVQLFLSLIITVAIGELHTWIYVYLFNDGISWPLQYTTDFPFTILLTVLLNFTYTGFFLQFEAKHLIPEPLESPLKLIPNPQIPITARIGSKNVLLDPEEVVLLFSKDKITRVLTREGKRYILDQSLKQAIGFLDQQTFFQTNRQTIINRKAIKGYQKLSSRKLELILHQNDLFPEPIFISKEKSPKFLNWLSA